MAKENEYKAKPVNLFWTGGWDSTFRLLQLVLEQGKVVQPYYLIDPKRQSVRLEIKAMRDVKRLISARYPEAKKLILPTTYIEISDIPPDEEINQAYRKFTIKDHLDAQYIWLATFCKQHGIHNMEVCTQIKIDPIAHPPRYFLEKVGNGPEYRLKDELRDGVEGVLFRNFRYPKYGITKLESKKLADAFGWTDIMSLTWFCHSPVRGRYPCGTCLPCSVVIKEGLGWRIPWHRRVYARLGLENVRNWCAKTIRKIYPKFHQWQG